MIGSFTIDRPSAGLFATDYAKTLLDDADAAAARSTLGLDSIATLDASLFVVKTSVVPDGASAVAHYLDTSTSYTTPGAKLLSVRNAGVEKFSVGYDGKVQFGLAASYLSLGNRDDDFCKYNGDISAALLISGEPSEAEVLAISRYYRTRYGTP